MDVSDVELLIDSSHFVGESAKEECKKYIKQIHAQPDPSLFYSFSIPPNFCQGDLVDSFDIVFLKITDGTAEIDLMEDISCVLLSNTCDMSPEGKNRDKYVSVALAANFEEYAANAKPDAYPAEPWERFLSDIKANKITNILYFPPKGSNPAWAVFLDKICSVDLNVLETRVETKTSAVVASLSRLGWYYFLIKLTYHFARFEDPSEVARQ